MWMKKLSALFCVFIFLISCKQEETPKGIIDKDKMTGILVDIHISDSYLNQTSNADTMLMQAKTRYNYIFKKYNIDSLKFSKSLNYYSLKANELDEIYKNVIDSLDDISNSLKPKLKLKPKSKAKAKSIKVQ
jgi:hypothetical protein